MEGGLRRRTRCMGPAQPNRRATHAVHQLTRSGATSHGEGVPDLPEIMEVHVTASAVLLRAPTVAVQPGRPRQQRRDGLPLRVRRVGGVAARTDRPVGAVAEPARGAGTVDFLNFRDTGRRGGVQRHDRTSWCSGRLRHRCCYQEVLLVRTTSPIPLSRLDGSVHGPALSAARRYFTSQNTACEPERLTQTVSSISHQTSGPSARRARGVWLSRRTGAHRPCARTGRMR